MKHLTSILSYTALKLDMPRIAKTFLQNGLTGKIGRKEPVLSAYLRGASHEILIEYIDALKLSGDYRSYLKSIVLRHEKNYREAYSFIKNIDDENLLQFKTRLLYDMKDIESLAQLSNRGKDIISQLNLEQRTNLLSYMTSRNMYDVAEQMIQQTESEKDLLIQQLEADRENVYFKYSWNRYTKDVLGISGPETINIETLKEMIENQDNQMKNLGFILLINHFHKDEEKVDWLNQQVVPYFKNKTDLYQYIDPAALHTYEFEIDQNDTRSLQLQKILNYYHAGSHSTQMMKSVLRLIPQVNLNHQHLMSIRRMILEGQFDIHNEDFQQLFMKDKRLHYIFHYSKLFLSPEINKDVDEFIHYNLNLRDKRKIYNQVVRQLIHTQAQMRLPEHFVSYLKESHLRRLSNAFILSRYYYSVGASSEREFLINSKTKEKQFKIRLYLAKLLFYRKRYEWSLYETQKASEIRPSHPAVIRNFIRNHHVMGNVSERYDNIVKMKENQPNKLYPNEYQMAKQEYELFHKEWQLNMDFQDYEKPERKDGVLFVLNKALPVLNGYTIRSQEIIKRVKQKGYRPVVATRLGWSPEQDGYKKPTEIVDGIPTYYIDRSDKYLTNKTPLNDYFDVYANEIYKIIQKEKPSIIHAASNFQNALPSLKVGKALDLSTIYEVRGLWHYTQSEKTPGFYNSERFKMQDDYEIICCQVADKVTCISESLKEYLIERGIQEDKITVIPNGVDTDQFQPAPEAEEIIEKYGLEDSVVMGFIGSLTSYEGIELIFEALHEIKKAGKSKKPLKFLIVGSGQHRSELEHKMKELNLEDDVIFAGRVPREEVAKFYSVIDIAPFPRKNEPVCQLVTPIKTYEAMSMEKKVIVSDVAALKEMVKEGINGHLFEADNVNALKDAILKIIEDDSIGPDARKWVVEHREWGVLIDSLIPLYKEAS